MPFPGMFPLEHNLGRVGLVELSVVPAHRFDEVAIHEQFPARANVDWLAPATATSAEKQQRQQRTDVLLKWIQ